MFEKGFHAWTAAGVRRLLPLLAALAGLLGAGPALAQDPALAPAPKPPVLLMFHAGGFVIGSPESLDRAAEAARARGFKTVQVAYTLGDSLQALRDARSSALDFARRRAVFAYGESAGGTLACRLAQMDLVVAAGCMSPVADVVSWARVAQPDPKWRHAFLGTREQQRYVGLVGRSVRDPVMAEIGADDYPVIAEGVERWAAEDSGVRLREVPGDHLGQDGSYDANMRRLIAWLALRAPSPLDGGSG